MRLCLRLTLVGLAGLVALVFASGTASAQQVELRLDGGDAYADLPFVLAAVADGFDEDSPPAQPDLALPGAVVTPLGMQPNVKTGISINSNGHRVDSRRVTFVYRWRISAPAGSYDVPALTLVQGSKKAVTRAARIRVNDVPASDDMRLNLILPDRAVSVGESLAVDLEWLLRRDVHDQTLVVPLFEMTSQVDVSVAPAAGQQTLDFDLGGRTVSLPFDRDQTTVDGVEFTRFTFHTIVTPLVEGSLAVPPAKVVAKLEVGTTRDRFGFPSPKLALVSASDVARTLEVKPLPLSGRPPSFAGAVGTGYAIEVLTSRSVVQLGEPLQLTVTVRSDSRLDGLRLPRLDVEGGLPKDQFSVPDDSPPGELGADGKSKTFAVSVRVIGAAPQIPPIPFAYFDPAKNAYQTVSSQPIALSVQGSAVVGAADVVGAVKLPGNGGAAGAGAGAGNGAELSLVGADLSLSSGDATRRGMLSVAAVQPFLYALYALPLLLLAFRLWQVSTRTRRGGDSELKRVRRRVGGLIERAAEAPAREVAAELAAALRELVRTAGLSASPDEAQVIERLETEGFAPGAAETRLAPASRAAAQELADRWMRGAIAAPARPGRASTTAAVLLVFSAAGATAARAEQPVSPAGAAQPAAAAAGNVEARLVEARDAYSRALVEHDVARRLAAFRQAAAAFADVVSVQPDKPELLADWGNAALGAGDVGTATLAFRRVLRFAPRHARALRNLSWLRSRQSDADAASVATGTSTLFFWHNRLTRASKHLIGAGAFAVAVLLLVPWSRRRTRLLRRLAIAPGLVWIAMLASLLLERDRSQEAVVTTAGMILRAADSPGAPAALTRPLSAGTEVEILEHRDGWSRIELPSGTSGWLPDGAVTSIDP